LHPVCIKSLDSITPTMGNSCAGKEDGFHEEMLVVVIPVGSSQDCFMPTAKRAGWGLDDVSGRWEPLKQNLKLQPAAAAAAASPRASASNTGDRTICGSFKEPVQGTNLHSAMAPEERVEHLMTKEQPGIVGTSLLDVQDGDVPSASRLDKTLASTLPLPSQDDLPRVGLGRPQGFRNGAEVMHKEISWSSSEEDHSTYISKLRAKIPKLQKGSKEWWRLNRELLGR